ncbi:hypothetical protein ACQY0O_006066 [Thecaphora frezii]
MRLLALFVALVPFVLADFPDPTVFQMDGFVINVYSDKLCVGGERYGFAFKLTKEGAHSSIRCKTKTISPLYPIQCQLEDQEECEGCRLKTLVSQIHGKDDKVNSACVRGIPHNLLVGDTDGMRALQKYFSEAIQGKYIAYWPADAPQKHVVHQIPNKPKTGTEVILRHP